MPEGAVEIVVSAQDIPRNTRIVSGTGALEMAQWPEDMVPEGAFKNMEAVFGQTSRVDIARGTPILSKMITEVPGEGGARGSDAALQIPKGKVAYAMPVSRYSSVAWALQPGDHVDVLVSLLMVDLDEEFQTILPNQAVCVSPTEEEGCKSGVMGRLEALSNGWIVQVRPSERQRPRLVSQLTVQNAMVLRVGDWEKKEVEGRQPVEATEGEGAETGEAGGAQAEPTPTPRESVRPLTLAVTPQQAVALKYLQESGASIDLVLRSAGDTGTVNTNSVTLEYLFESFGIETPPKVPYGVTPPLQSLGSNAAGSTGAPEGGGGEAPE